MQELIESYLGDLIADGWRLRAGQTRASVIAAINQYFVDDLAACIEHAKDGTEAQAAVNWFESGRYEAAECIAPSEWMWNPRAGYGGTEQDYDANRKAEWEIIVAKLEVMQAELSRSAA